jgi:hypothetical protein
MAVAGAVFALCAGISIVLGLGSSGSSTTARALAAKNVPAFIRAREGAREQGADSAAGRAYALRAYPATTITFAQQRRAAKAAEKIKEKGSKLDSKWDELGPSTLNVDRLGTQTYQVPTQWSGRETAMAVDPACGVGVGKGCTLYIGAAGGGVWRTKNALAPAPSWKFISDGIPTNAIGSIAIDPNDPTGQTIYVGTGEGNGSGDSDVGLGLFKTTDGGSHWSVVAGSVPFSTQKTIPGLAIDPTDRNHILIGTRNGVAGISSNGCCAFPPGVPTSGIFESHDGGATFARVRTGTTHEIEFDPSNASVVYAAAPTTGLIRSTTGGASGSWETIFSGTKGRYTFSSVKQANGKTRIYLADSEPDSQAYRIDDASQSAATLTASDNAAWTRLSSSTDGTPGFASYRYCEGQCFYDMRIASPAGNPNMVVLSGLMNYGELPPYGGADRSNGRSVLLSTDAGATWTDQTGDPAGESMHPDQHTIGFVPTNPDVMFLGSDGGVIRTSGTYADGRNLCTARELNGVDLTDCNLWLRRIPSKLTPINGGLSTLQLYSMSLNPQRPYDDGLAGTQDNGSISFSGSPTWRLGLTGDGGDSGFDAVEPAIRFHTYYFGYMDVNFQGDTPENWLWVADPFVYTSESIEFDPPTIADPVRGGTIFVGAEHVWRTQDSGGDREFLEQHCNTTGQFGTSDQLFSGNCGDFEPVGPSLTDAGLGSRDGGDIIALGRGTDTGTLWAATIAGRIFVSRNAQAAPGAVAFTRIDDATAPERDPNSISVDPSNPLHAIVTYNGYGVNTPSTPGHVFDVVFNPGTGTATWKDISYDLGDQPVADSVYDVATGDVYVSTDFGVWRLASGSSSWTPAAANMPLVQVPGLTLVDAKNDTRLLYAATHGRGAYRLTLKK